jgi:hypothetical protein
MEIMRTSRRMTLPISSTFIPAASTLFIWETSREGLTPTKAQVTSSSDLAVKSPKASHRLRQQDD